MKLRHKLLNQNYNYFIIGSILIISFFTFLGLSYKNFDKTKISKSENEIICLSMRVLIDRAKNNQYNEDVKTLAGIGSLDGYVIDKDMGDIILFGRRSEPPTTLTLDDLVVNIRNIWNKEPYPYCSLDPLPENNLKLNKLISKFGDASGIGEMKENFDKIKEAVGPQNVVIGGVPKNSRHAHTMIDADYHMKKVSQGLIKLDNVRSCLDITLDEYGEELRSSGELTSKESMSRFWFHIAEGEPIYKEGNGIIYLDKCSVVILTEKQKTTADGELYDSGGDDPTAETFAKELSDNFREAALVESSYANLENLYRLQALLKAIYYRDEIETAGLDINFLIKGYKYLDETNMPASLPGLANYIATQLESEKEDAVYTYTLFPIVCGGVSMEVPCKKSQFMTAADKNEAEEVRNIIVSSRPNPNSLYWLMN